MSGNFEQNLQQGRVGEMAIASWLRSKGYSVLSVYDIPLDAEKGPRLYASFASGHDKLIAPDILALANEKTRWVEAKYKTKFAYFGMNKAWQTGIDLRHYQHYLHVKETTNLDLWLLFLHTSSLASSDDLYWGSPKECPTGLFGGEISYLQKNEAQQGSYKSGAHSYPMVYWKHEALRKFATLEEMLACQPVEQEPLSDEEAIQAAIEDDFDYTFP